MKKEGKKLSKIVLLLVLVAILLMIFLFVMAIIGALSMTDGCLYRYNFHPEATQEEAEDSSDFGDLLGGTGIEDVLGEGENSNQGTTGSNNIATTFSQSTVVNSIILKANGNYEANGNDPNKYGRWINTNLSVTENQIINFKVKGRVSLCKAYIPKNNLQDLSNLDTNSELIAIPRVDDKVSAPINLIFDAKVAEWRNIAELFKNDQIQISISSDRKNTGANSSIYNNFTDRTESADCSENQKTYDPLCGRYSIWSATDTYVDSCEYIPECIEHNCQPVCQGFDNFGSCMAGYETECSWYSCYGNILSTAPENYQNDGKYTSPWYGNLSDYTTNFDQNCRDNHEFVAGDWQEQKYFWYSADNVAGLIYRFDQNEEPTDKENMGSNFYLAKLLTNQGAINSGTDYKLIIDEINDKPNTRYLQFRYPDFNTDPANHTGGYVLNIKQTKCRRENGEFFDDTYPTRGAIQYVIARTNNDPNNVAAANVSSLMLDPDGHGTINLADDASGFLWLRINNEPSDYPDSSGQYNIEYSTTTDNGDFSGNILDRFIDNFKQKIQNVSEQVFRNLTCYQGTGGNGDCINFFNYIRSLLTLYIMFYGMMFLIGSVKVSQTDIAIRVIKVGLVAGLLDGRTFNFFNEYVFDFLTGFTDEIIGNMAGLSLFSDSGTVTNPFNFMNEIMTKVFLSPVFTAQILSLLAMGISGVIYFILIIVCLGIVLIVLLKSIAVYLMAFMAITILIGLTPLFLSFILFQRTFYLFDNWVKFTFRYMVEPVILLAGIIVLTQLFTIYLDFAIGYSVCWKCAIPIRIPLVGLLGISIPYLDMELFCINWFAPWGFDYRSGQMGLNLQNFIALMMIAYCMWGYMSLATSMTKRLVGSAGGPSANDMGGKMSSTIQETALSQVGLDKKTRARINKEMTQRSDAMSKAQKDAPIGINRKDTTHKGESNKPKKNENKDKGPEAKPNDATPEVPKKED